MVVIAHVPGIYFPLATSLVLILLEATGLVFHFFVASELNEVSMFSEDCIPTFFQKIPYIKCILIRMMQKERLE
jgi:hypothetical protein